MTQTGGEDYSPRSNLARSSDDDAGIAVITGASTGVGYELAKCCAENNFQLTIAADEPQIEEAARSLRNRGTVVEPVECDLATLEGVDRLCGALAGRPVEVLIANAGRGLGKAFLDQNFTDIRRVVDTNITGTISSRARLPALCRARSARCITPAKHLSTRSPSHYATN